MKQLQRVTQIIFFSLLLPFLCTACSVRQDNTNFEKYLKQDTTIKGKAGVLITALGQPEDYDFTFFNNYLNLIFNSSFPPILKFIAMRDKGTVLRDPENLFVDNEFKPKTLMDCFGNTKNADGVPYADLQVEWVKPRKKGDGGHFLWEKKNGYIDIAEKSSIKIVASYYARMPGKKIPYIQQHQALFKDIKLLIAEQFPGTPVRTAWTMYPETIKNAIDELIQEKVETIVVCDLFPVYSNLEEFNSLFVEIDHLVAGRAKIIFAPSVGAFSSFRNAYVKMAEDEIAKRSNDDKSLIVLTRHGFPEMPGESYNKLAPAFYQNLEKEVSAVVGGKNTSVVFADTEFASDDDDPDNKRLSSAEALKMGLEKQYHNIIFILVDFMSENTDTVYCAREEALEPINFEYGGIVPYNDFSQPFRTELIKDKTRIVIAGTPVGSRYRTEIAKGIFDAAATILQGKQWPQLVQKSEKAEKPEI